MQVLLSSSLLFSSILKVTKICSKNSAYHFNQHLPSGTVGVFPPLESGFFLSP